MHRCTRCKTKYPRRELQAWHGGLYCRKCLEEVAHLIGGKQPIMPGPRPSG